MRRDRMDAEQVAARVRKMSALGEAKISMPMLAIIYKDDFRQFSKDLGNVTWHDIVNIFTNNIETYEPKFLKVLYFSVIEALAQSKELNEEEKTELVVALVKTPVSKFAKDNRPQVVYKEVTLSADNPSLDAALNEYFAAKADVINMISENTLMKKGGLKPMVREAEHKVYKENQPNVGQVSYRQNVSLTLGRSNSFKRQNAVSLQIMQEVIADYGCVDWDTAKQFLARLDDSIIELQRQLKAAHFPINCLPKQFIHPNFITERQSLSYK